MVEFEEKILKAGFLELLQEKTDYDRLTVKALKEISSIGIAELLNDYSVVNKSDLIVVLRENRSFFESIFKSDLSENIVKESMLPVLVFHEKE